MLHQKLEGYRIILASGSPRRQQFFEDLKIPFHVRLKEVDEIYPDTLKGAEISDYLAELKASPQKWELLENEILITSDTVVWHKGESLAKAGSDYEAVQMLQKLSGTWHQVITSVCFTTTKQQILQNALTEVKFKNLSTEEIEFYIENYRPFDKAGAYGIQEWLGLIGIEEIKGSYPNVVGLPTQLVYKTLLSMIS